MLFYDGFSQAAGHAAPYPAVERNFTLRILSRPVLQPGKPTADSLLEACAISLHHWEPNEASGISEITVPRGTLIDDDEFLIYDLTLTVKSRL
jgi:hypothetical protein